VPARENRTYSIADFPQAVKASLPLLA